MCPHESNSKTAVDWLEKWTSMSQSGGLVFACLCDPALEKHVSFEGLLQTRQVRFVWWCRDQWLCHNWAHTYSPRRWHCHTAVLHFLMHLILFTVEFLWSFLAVAYLEDRNKVGQHVLWPSCCMSWWQWRSLCYTWKCSSSSKSRWECIPWQSNLVDLFLTHA